MIIKEKILSLLKHAVFSFPIEISGEIVCNNNDEGDMIGFYLNGSSHQVQKPIGHLTFHSHPEALMVAKSKKCLPVTNQDICGQLFEVYEDRIRDKDYSLVCAPEGAGCCSVDVSTRERVHRSPSSDRLQSSILLFDIVRICVAVLLWCFGISGNCIRGHAFF
jgi:hypothetical protein